MESQPAPPTRLAEVLTRLRSIGLVALRGLALFLPAFTVIGIIGELRGRTSDVSLWWIDLRDLPLAGRLALLLAFASLLVWWAVRAEGGGRLRWVTVVVCRVLAAFAARDVVRFYAVVGGGNVRPAIGEPLSLIVCALLLVLAAVVARGSRDAGTGSRRTSAGAVIAAGAWAALFPLAQMLFFGTTDYRRPADAAVIFGARVYASGQPSPLLADRIRTGIELYDAGLVPLLVMSGGDGSDGFNEARVMRDVAVAAGVAASSVLIDPNGNTTEATVANASAMLAARNGGIGTGRIIAVSQAYHLPRIQLAFANAGIDVLTVPAGELEPIHEMPLFVAREVPAFWAYYLRVCLG